MEERQKEEKAAAYITVVRQVLDRVLEYGRDHSDSRVSPLFVDGLHVGNLEPVKWRLDGEEWTLSNLGSQQNLLRTLDGFSRLTGEQHYKQASTDAVQYAFQHLRYGDLLCWGGHMAFDLKGQKQIFAPEKGPQHELKCHYPYYELMHEVDSAETKKYMEALWDSHISNWENLEFSRHGKPRESKGDAVWDREYMGGEVFFTAKGLTFINAGSDLYYAAGMLHSYTGNEKPLIWAKRLARRYVETRHPVTGMGGYQFSISVLPGQRGDRAVDQFGEQLKEHSPIEATLSVTRQIGTIIGPSALIRLTLAETLGSDGKEFLDGAVEDLLAYGTYAYDAADNMFHPVLTNGTRLTGLVMEKSGYYGRQGEALQAAPAGPLLLFSYAKAFRLSGNERLWSTARSIALGNGLGDIGLQKGAEPHLNLMTRCSHPMAVFALLELYRGTNQQSFLELAVTAADQMIKDRYHHGFFLPSAEHIYAKLDSIEPLALLHLTSELRGMQHRLPAYSGSSSFFQSAHDGYEGTQTDNTIIYGQTRS